MSLYLSRLILARNPTTAALKALIDPAPDLPPTGLRSAAQGRMMDAHHRLLWSLFGDKPDRERDFLWRAQGNGQFLTLSARPPSAEGGGLFEPPEIKPFEPKLQVGDHLNFVLRANATRTRRLSTDPKARASRVDVVMDAIHALPSGRTDASRRNGRMAAADAAGRQWLDRQGEKSGFVIERASVTDYSVAPLPNHSGSRERQPQFGILEFTGEIRVTEPEVLVRRIAEGFGRAKAFGCGLMLIRRA